ncbi:MAG: hypothetical protein ACI8TP_001272, partial [Acidimicrobiales bacterium]
AMLGLDERQVEQQMGPQQVAPVVVYLCHESCELTGETLSAFGGRVARTFVGVNPGIHDSNLTPETVADRIDEIVDETGYIVPNNVDDEFSLLADFLQ